MKTLILIFFMTISLNAQSSELIMLFSGEEFVMADIPNLEIHYQAGDATIPSWNDISGNEYHLTTVNDPTLGSIDGLATMVFNGSNEYAKVDTIDPNITAPYTMYCVYKPLTLTNFDNLLDVGMNKQTILQSTGTPDITKHYSQLWTTNDTLNVWHITTYTFDASSDIKMRLSFRGGEWDTTRATTGHSITKINLAARTTDGTAFSRFGHVEWAELIIIDREVIQGSAEDINILADLRRRMPSLP